MIFLTSPGKTYSVNSVGGCTISAGGTTLATIPANVQTTFIAPEEEVLVSDNNAIIVEVTGVGAGGSGGTGGSGGSGGPIDLTGVALLEGGNTFTGDQIINGDLTVSGDVTAEGEYNGAEVIETTDTTIIPESGKYYKYTGTEDTITVVAPVWIGYMTISYLETAEPVELEGVTWSPAKPSLTGAGPFVYTLACSEPGKVLASAMNYSVATAEAIQNVVPIAWGAYTKAPVVQDGYSYAFGSLAVAKMNSNALGYNARGDAQSQSIGYGTLAKNNAIAIGHLSQSNYNQTITLGAQYTEILEDNSRVINYCQTEGTGSITIGVGANTRNNGSTESSDSVTIGHKAFNQGADSVVIGASANSVFPFCVAIGAGVKTDQSKNNGVNSVAIGYNAETRFAQSVAIGSAGYSSLNSVAVGFMARAKEYTSICLGSQSSATAQRATAIGFRAAVSDLGATVIRSTAEDGTITQLYFSGANTPLANTYEDGEAMMGYVVKDSAGNVMTDAEGNAMVGTQKLSVLFPNNRGENAFTPAALNLDDEYTPKPMFRPSDLDLPVEEPTKEPEDITINIPEPEPEPYTPLPVYPIVEPEES